MLQKIRMPWLKTFLLFILLVACLVTSPVANSSSLEMRVIAPFIDVHSGAGEEFPIVHVISEGERFFIIKQRYNWFKVQTVDDRVGWISTKSIELARLLDGSELGVSTASFAGYHTRDYEITAFAGALDKVTSLSLSASWVWTKNLSVEATYTQALGNFADNKIWSIRMRQTFFPDWRVSPFVALGTGEIKTKPRTNLVQSGAEIRNSNHYEVGVGLEYYMTANLVVIAEYRGLLVLTNRDEQERLDQWMLGARVFF